jgi:NAD+ diphosphatase
VSPGGSGNPFSGAFLERHSERRADSGWLDAARADPATRFVVSTPTTHLVHEDEPARIAFLAHGHALVLGSDPAGWILLGWYDGVRCVHVEPADGGSSAPEGTRYAELRPLLAELPHADAALLATARALLGWRARHRHCGACGAPTRPANAGHSLRCTSSTCGTEFFPRIDPAIIVLVSDGDHALLGRQASWPPGRYSPLAGFVEPGETLEDTVVREVYEEAGVRVAQVRYFASQPWPFPASLMLGFRASADRSAPLRLDGELEDARWFSAAELAQDLPSLLLPPPFTIARRLIDAWLLEARDGHAAGTGRAARRS